LKIIVGLGNPGRKYEQTPHNIGFAVIDELADIMSCALKKSLRFNAFLGKTVWNGKKVLLIKPQTYMNNSGEAVGSVVRYQKVDASEIVVVSDDADLELGVLRVRVGGGSAGHRGINSLVQHLGTKEFARVRVGVGKGREGQGLEDHVLQRFSVKEKGIAEKIVATSAQSVLHLLESGVEETMNIYNGRQDVE
jgi:PTH1 family peptidyl-tRNA hydrolase